MTPSKQAKVDALKEQASKHVEAKHFPTAARTLTKANALLRSPSNKK